VDSLADLGFADAQESEEHDLMEAFMKAIEDTEEAAEVEITEEESVPTAPKFMSITLVGANCDNIIRNDGVLAGISKLNCGKFMIGAKTRIFTTGRDKNKANPILVWREPPVHAGCTLDRFEKEIETVVMEGPDKVDQLNDALNAFDGGNGTRIFYLCMPPSISPQYAAAISKRARGRSKDIRLMMEKPIGTDLVTAKDVEKQLKIAGFRDEELYLVDHFLGEPMIDLMTRYGFRGDSASDVMNSFFFDKRVLIMQAESRDLTGRVASFFEGVGQVRDVTQSHLMQMLAVAALPPGKDVDISEAKAFILSKTKAVKAEEGQYNGYLSQLLTEGTARGKDINLSDMTVAYSTYSKMTFNVGTKRWDGVPFVVETGKNLDADNWLVKYESTYGCNMVLNVWGHPEESEPPKPMEESYWLELENPHVCPSRVVKFAQRVWNKYGGITRSAQIGWRYKLFPPQGKLPAYANIMASVVAGSRDQCIDFMQVTSQWRSVEEFLDLPTNKVSCYEKCATYTSADLAAGRPRPVCPQLGMCILCNMAKKCQVGKNVTVADAIAPSLLRA